MQKGVIVKYILISRLAPGIDNARKALEVFQKAGLAPGSEAVWQVPMARRSSTSSKPTFPT